MNTIQDITPNHSYAMGQNDDAVALLLDVGQRALFSKTDIDSAFRLVPITHLTITFSVSNYRIFTIMIVAI